MKRHICILGFLLVLLSGCATKPPSSYSFISGREIIEKPPLIKIPEQRTNFRLMYGNDASLERSFNQYARTGKAPNIITDGFIKFAYNQGQQPIIKTSPFQETVISLEPGERFTNISSGDPNRWSYSVAVSGSGQKQQQNVLVKPSMPDIVTNMVITTNERIYNLRLLSTTKATTSRNVSFWYPEEMLNTLNQEALRRVDDTRVASVPDVSLNHLNFNYKVSCGLFCHSPNWSPSRVFDDGTHTYIQFPAELSNRDMPALFVLDNRVKELVNYRSKPPYFVVDKVFKQAALIIGVGRSQSAVMITNKNYF